MGQSTSCGIAFATERPRSVPTGLVLRGTARNRPPPEGPFGAKRGLSAKNEAFRGKKVAFRPKGHPFAPQDLLWAIP
eukprot:6117794-Alexandrium_andersonii.AAC.1